MSGESLPDVAEDVVKRLTDAQRRAMTRQLHPQWEGMISSWGDASVARTLWEIGLIEKPKTLAEPTLLGLRVRALLVGDDG